MNNVIRGAVGELGPRYKDRLTMRFLSDIRSGESRWRCSVLSPVWALCRDAAVHLQSAGGTHMESDDFMLELYIRLFAGRCAALSLFDGSKALFKTYLSKIAHNLCMT